MLSLIKDQQSRLRLEKKLQLLGINELAIRSGFLKRQPKKIDPSGLLVSFLTMIIGKNNSLSSIAVTLGMLRKKRISKQAVDKRINVFWVDFLRAFLERSLSYYVQIKRTFTDGSALSVFNRVLIQDSTSIALAPKLIKQFPGTKNGTGRSTAMMKIQSVFNLLTERFILFDISPFSKNDQSASCDILNRIQPGDLVIRDLGYFVLDVFKKFHSLNAYFLSRLKHGILVFDQDGKTRFDLVRRLRKDSLLDALVCFGKKEKFSARLITIPVTDEVAASRRRKARRNRDRRMNPSKDHLFLMGWDIFITNVDCRMLSSEQIVKLYRLRWRIEILFKSWKSHFHIMNVPKASVKRVLAYVYATLIFIVLFQALVYIRLQNDLLKNKNQLSLFKLSKFVKEQSWAIMSFFLEPNRLDEQILYHCIYEPRKNRLNYNQLMLALS
jgi:hypothetical protein